MSTERDCRKRTSTTKNYRQVVSNSTLCLSNSCFLCIILVTIKKGDFMLSNILFYGLVVAALVLTYVATDQLETRLKNIEEQIEMQNVIIDKLRG